MCLLLFHYPLVTKTNETVISVAHAALLTRNYRQKETTIKASTIIMTIIFSTIIALFIILLFSSFAAWLEGKHKKEFFEKAIDKLTSFLDTKMEVALDEHKAGPWYLVVYTQDSGYPILISHNTIRCVHPDPKNGKIIVKQFNGEDVVIDNVSSYEMYAANDIIGCGMKKDIQHYLTE